MRTSNVSAAFLPATNAAWGLLILFVFMGAPWTYSADPVPGTVDSTFNPGTGPDGPVVKMLVQFDGKIVIAGPFTNVNGFPRPGIARLNADGTVDPNFNPGQGIPPFTPPPPIGFNGEFVFPAIFLAQQLDGKIIASNGWLTSYDGVSRPYAVRINIDGSIDPSFNPPSSIQGVRALLPDGKMLTQTPLARLNADGTIDTTFQPDLTPVLQVGPGYSQHFRELAGALPDAGKLLILDHIYDPTVPNCCGEQLLRLNSDGSFDSSYTPSFGSTVFAFYFQRDALARHINGGTLVANAGQVLRYTSNGLVDPSFVPIGSNSFRLIQCMAVQVDGKIVVGGALPSSDGRIARLNVDGSLDSNFNTPPGFATNAVGKDFFVYDVAVQADGKILMAGNFLTIDGNTRSYIGRLYGGPPGPPAILTPPIAQTVSEGRTVSFSVVAADIFTGSYQWLFNGATIPGATNATLVLTDVRTNLDGAYSVTLRTTAGENTSAPAILTVLPPEPPVIQSPPASQSVTEGATVNFSVTATNFLPLTYQWQFNGSVIIGATNSTLILTNVRMTNAGIYSVIVSTALRSATSGGATLLVQPARLVDPSFFPGTGPELTNTPLATPSYFGGTFLGGVITLIAVQHDGRTIVAGPFLRFGGVPRNRIVRLNVDGSVDATFDPGVGVSAGPDITDIASIALQPDGKVLIGGRFTQVGTSNRLGIARLNADGSLDPSFIAGVTVGPPNINIVRVYGFPYVASFAVQPDGKILIGGPFQKVNGIARNCIARLNQDGSLDTSFDPSQGLLPPVNFTISLSIVRRLILQPDNNVLVQGNFARAFQTNIDRLGLARFKTDGTLDTNFNPVATGLDWGQGINSMLLSTNGDIVTAGFFTTNGVSKNHLARLKSDGSLDPGFNPAAGLDGVFNTGPGADRPLTAILQADGRIIVAGNFTNIAGAKRMGLVRLQGNGALDASFDPGQGADGGLAYITALTVRPDSDILVAGQFSTFDNIPRNGIAALFSEDQIPRLVTLSASNGTLSFSLSTLSGKSYQVDFNDSLSVTNWRSFQGFTGDGNTKVFNELATYPHRFFRVRVQ